MPGERRPKRNPDFPPKEFTEDEGFKRLKKMHKNYLAAREQAHQELEQEKRQTGKFKRPALIEALKKEVDRLDKMKEDMDWYVDSTIPHLRIGTASFRVQRETPRDKTILEHAGRVTGKALIGEKPTNIQGEKIGEDPGTTRLMTREEFEAFVSRLENEAAFRNPATHADKEMIPVARPKKVWDPNKDTLPKETKPKETKPKKKKIIDVTTAPSAQNEQAAKPEITPAFPRAVPSPVEKPAAPQAPSREALEQSSLEEYGFDEEIKTLALFTLGNAEKPTKEKKEFFKHLNSRTRLLFPEATANKQEVRKAFIEGTKINGKNVTESDLIFAFMDFFRAKYENSQDFPDLEQEMVYEATRREVDKARGEKAAAQPQIPQTKRVPVDANYERKYKIKPSKRPEAKQKRTPWFKILGGAVLAALGGAAGGKAIYDSAQERPGMSRTNEDGGRDTAGGSLASVFEANQSPVESEVPLDPNYDGELQNPSSYQPYPAEPGYEPAPRISATEAAIDAEGETTVTPYQVPNAGQAPSSFEER